MEIESFHEGRSAATTTTGERKPTSKACSMIIQETIEDKIDDDKNDNNSDSDDSTTCPLFMDGLPKKFATNPQLAAIASLLNDEDDYVVNDNANVDATKSCEKRPDHQHGITARARDGISHCRSTRIQNRRRQQRATPYPRQKNQTNKEKNASVGEITLFMNMWKP
uniref:Uncharacterized protein n=1 Tax=Pseudo-nitzschia australis TaxID=44445 RepID=A0A7S4ALU3_9STRA|mmetsp:Transcript_560/g.1315  ORF Transcript_560/g.1315 Transcript_560/m.1315 type:complete len:166 (+) Transcript_560:82-579(+)